MMPLFPALTDWPGVAYTAPPPHLIQDAIDHVTAEMASVPKDAHGAVVAVASRTAEGRVIVNAAVAVHGPRGVEIAAWVGKTWGERLQVGITGVKVF